MITIQAAHAVVALETKRGIAQVIFAATGKMPHGMASKRVSAQHEDVERQHERADSDTERRDARLRVCEPQRLPNISCEEKYEDNCEVQKVPVNVLNNERE